VLEKGYMVRLVLSSTSLLVL